MRLAQKLALRLGALLLVMALLGGVGWWGLMRLDARLQAAHDDYEQLRLYYEIGNACATARLLATHDVDHEVVRQQLLRADASTRQLIEQAANHEVVRDPAALRESVHKAMLWNDRHANVAPTIDHLNAVLLEVASAASGLSRQIVERRQEAQQYLAETGRVMAMTFGLAVIILAATGIQQYRGIMGPLTSLESGVLAMTRANFAQRLTPRGDYEFRQLAQHFNEMARQLHELYRDLEAQVQMRTRQLLRSEQLAGVGLLAAGVAHEINNPLAIIAGHAEASMRRIDKAGTAVDGALQAKTRDALQIIAEEAFRCKQITTGLLTLARPGEPHHREALALAPIAQRVITLLSDLPQYRERQVTLTVGEDVPRVVGNASELTQVLLNVVRNALDATPTNQGRVTVEVLRRGRWAVVRVSDNGRGMTAECLARIFEPFFTHGSRIGGEGAGTGLGLAVSHAVVEQHDGSIHAHSDGPGRGSVFTIELPAVEESGDVADMSVGAQQQEI